jgi:hypothetical protein
MLLLIIIKYKMKTLEIKFTIEDWRAVRGQMKKVSHLIINLQRQLSHESMQTDSTIFGCHAEKTLPTSAESTKMFF